MGGGGVGGVVVEGGRAGWARWVDGEVGLVKI
jgi:hypothetical protein